MVSNSNLTSKKREVYSNIGSNRTRTVYRIPQNYGCVSHFCSKSMFSQQIYFQMNVPRWKMSFQTNVPPNILVSKEFLFMFHCWSARIGQLRSPICEFLQFSNFFWTKKKDARSEIIYTHVEFLELGGTDGSGANSRAKKTFWKRNHKSFFEF